ncbi:MAG: hypothetical protein ACFE9R_14725 [Candidatus Hermodarchaeota archaeon]
MSSELFEKVKRYQYITKHIRNRSVHSLKSKMGWKGKGSKEDPIIIDNVEGLKPTLIFTTHNLFFIIRNIIVYKLVCNKTENITVENCKIFELEIKGSYNLKIINNSIFSLKVDFFRASVVKNNEIHGHNIDQIDFDEAERRVKVAAGVITCVFIMMLFLVFYIPYNDINFWWLSVLFAGICIGLIFLINLMTVGWRRTRSKGNNTIDANYKMTDVRSILYDAFTFYQYFQKKWYLYLLLPLIGGMLLGVAILAIVFGLYFRFYVFA